MIERCLGRDSGKLRNLHCFDETPSDEMADYFDERLIVEPLTEDKLVLRLRLITSNKGDSPTLLNHLVQTYEESLRRKVERDHDREIKSFQALLDECNTQYKQQKNAIQNLRSQKKSIANQPSMALQISRQIMQPWTALAIQLDE